MKRISITAIISLMLPTSHAIAAQKVKVFRVDEGSCGTWVNERNNKIRNQEAWLFGYLSGLMSAAGKDLLKNTSFDSIPFWMDNYCKENPLNKLDVGAHQLILELNKKEK